MSSATPTILMVEDDKEIRRFVRLALETDGCHVVEAEGYQRGLIEAATRQPDLLMLDLGLPDGDGVEFIRKLRGWSPLPIQGNRAILVHDLAYQSLINTLK